MPKSPLKMGRGFEARATHPCPTQIWEPPPAIHFLSFVLAVFTCPWYTVNSVTCAPFACFCFGSLLNSVVFWLCITCIIPWTCYSPVLQAPWLYACPGFLIVMVFQGHSQPHSPGWGQEFHFPHFFLKFGSSFLTFPQTFLIFFLILALRVGMSPTREGPGYTTVVFLVPHIKLVYLACFILAILEFRFQISTEQVSKNVHARSLQSMELLFF